MNQSPSNQSGVNSTFSSQPASQTNPFTADLKGEFTSNFGTNTNAVSQIFKEGGFVANNRMKYYIIGGVVLIAAALAFFIFTDSSETGSEDEFAEDSAPAAGDTATTDAAEDTAKKDVAAADAAKKAEEASAATEAAAAAQTAPSAASGSISLTMPDNGASLAYDETQGAASFTWEGGGGQIVFSRHANMKPEVFRINVSGNSYSFNHPWPGNWFWRVENSAGSSEVRSFKVSAPARRNVSLSQPAAGASLAGTGGEVTWQGDNAVAYYRVELSNSDWSNPQFKFSTSGNKVQLQGVPAGAYQLRVGAFSEVAGRWEYTPPVSVTVQ